MLPSQMTVAHSVFLAVWIGPCAMLIVNLDNATYGVVVVNQSKNFTSIRIVSPKNVDFEHIIKRCRMRSFLEKNPSFDDPRYNNIQRDLTRTGLDVQHRNLSSSNMGSIRGQDQGSTLSTRSPNASTIAIDGRIVGGRYAEPGEVGHFVGLSAPDGQFYCGGILISLEWFLSARHCFVDKNVQWNKKVFLAVAGATHRDFSLDGDRFQTSLIDWIYWHGFGDIALCKLKTPMKQTAYVYPICYYTSRDTRYVDTRANEMAPVDVSGFGEDRLKDQNGVTVNYPPGSQGHPAQLKTATVNLIRISDCTRFAQNYVPPGFSKKAYLCALSNYKGTCHGDSGGPMVLDGKLVGITSWGVGCALPDYPFVFVRVDYYDSWIESIMGKGKKCSGANPYLPEPRISVVLVCLLMAHWYFMYLLLGI